MLNQSTLSMLTKSLITKQVKVLSQLYGAVCDQQYLLTAKPTFARRLSDDDTAHADMSSENKEPTSESSPPEFWRDPFAAKVELSNPSCSDDDPPQNISMI